VAAVAAAQKRLADAIEIMKAFGFGRIITSFGSPVSLVWL